MNHRTSTRRLLRGPGSFVVAAVVAALVMVVANPGVTYAWTSYSFSSSDESSTLTLINQLRAANGKPALVMDSSLVSEARKRSKDMYDKNYFSHSIPPDGHTVFTELTAMGYCYSNAAENIGWNNYPDDQTTSVNFNGWKNSSGHLANMLGNFTRVGIGAFKGDGRDAGSGTFGVDTTSYPVHVFTAVFATPCGSSTPKPTPTPTPKPTATPRPTPTPTPRPTPTPTPRPTPTPAGTPHPTPTPTPTPQPTPTPTPAPTDTGGPPTPTPAASNQASDAPSDAPSDSPAASDLPSDSPAVTAEPSDPAEALGRLAGDPRFLPGDGTGEFFPEPTPVASGSPEPTFETGSGVDGLQVVEPLPDQTLIDAIVGGVAGTFFGH